MPRTAGLSGSSRVWFMRRNPSDSTVARICGLAPMGLFTSVALIVSAPPAVPATSPLRGEEPFLIVSAPPAVPATSPLRGEEPFLIVSATCPSGAWCCRGPLTLTLSAGGRGKIGGGEALAHHLLHVLAAQVGDLGRRLQSLQGGESRSHRVDGVVGAVRLGENVLDAGGLDDRTHRTARDDAGTWSRRLEHDARGSPLVLDRVGNRRADHRHRDHVAFGDLHPFADGLGHLTRLADSGADAAVHVADDDEGAEGELAPALHDLGDAVDADHAVGELGPFSARVWIPTAHVSTQNSKPASPAASASALILPW